MNKVSLKRQLLFAVDDINTFEEPSTGRNPIRLLLPDRNGAKAAGHVNK